MAGARVDRRERVALVVGHPQRLEVPRRRHVLGQLPDGEVVDDLELLLRDDVDGVGLRVRDVDAGRVALDDAAEQARGARRRRRCGGPAAAGCGRRAAPARARRAPTAIPATASRPASARRARAGGRCRRHRSRPAAGARARAARAASRCAFSDQISSRACACAVRPPTTVMWSGNEPADRSDSASGSRPGARDAPARGIDREDRRALRGEVRAAPAEHVEAPVERRARGVRDRPRQPRDPLHAPRRRIEADRPRGARSSPTCRPRSAPARRPRRPPRSAAGAASRPPRRRSPTAPAR